MTEKPPIACTLSPDELRARGHELLPGLAAAAERIDYVGGGIRLQFAPSTSLATIARVIEAERHCCKFLAFALTADANDGPVALTVTAPAEAEDLLRDLVGAPSV
jgi:hypothetical protein